MVGPSVSERATAEKARKWTYVEAVPPRLGRVARGPLGMCYIEAPMPDAPAPPPAPPRRARVALTVVIAVLTLALDLWSKNWAWENLRRGKPIMVIDPLLEFSFSFNLGAAFG